MINVVKRTSKSSATASDFDIRTFIIIGLLYEPLNKFCETRSCNFEIFFVPLYPEEHKVLC